MNDRERRQFVASIERLHNWLQRSRLPPAAFVSANRDQLDRAIRDAIPALDALRRRLRQTHRLRRWSELTDKQKARLVDHWKRGKHRAEISYTDRFKAARLHIVTEDIEAASGMVQQASRARYQSSYDKSVARRRILRVRSPKPLPKDTPADRLEAIRREKAKSIFNGLHLGKRKITFVPDLHPDDVEIISVPDLAGGPPCNHLAVHRHFVKLSAFFNAVVAACVTVIDDTDTEVKVFKIARIKAARKIDGDKRAVVEVCFIGTAPELRTKTVKLTNRHSTAKAAYAAALRLYGSIVAGIIEPGEDQ